MGLWREACGHRVQCGHQSSAALCVLGGTWGYTVAVVLASLLRGVTWVVTAAGSGNDAALLKRRFVAAGAATGAPSRPSAAEPTAAQRAAAEALAANHSHVAMAAAAAAAEHAAALGARDAAAAAVQEARRHLAEAEAAAAAADAALGGAAQRSGAAAELAAELARDARTLSAAAPRTALCAGLSQSAGESFEALLAAATHATPGDAAAAEFYQPALYNPILYTAAQLGVTEVDHKAYLQLFVPYGLEEETAAAAAAGDAAAVDRANAIFAAWLDAQVGQQAAAAAAADGGGGTAAVGGEADVTGLNRSIYLDSHGLPFVINEDGSHSYLDPRRDEAAAAALGYVLEHGDDDTDVEVDPAELEEIWEHAPAHVGGISMHAGAGSDAASGPRSRPRGTAGAQQAASAAGRQETRDGRKVSSRSRVLSKRLKESVLGEDEEGEEPRQRPAEGGGDGVVRSSRKRRRTLRLHD